MIAAVVATAFLALAPAQAQIVTKYAGIQPIDHPSSYSEKYFGEWSLQKYGVSNNS